MLFVSKLTCTTTSMRRVIYTTNKTLGQLRALRHVLRFEQHTAHYNTMSRKQLWAFFEVRLLRHGLRKQS